MVGGLADAFSNLFVANGSVIGPVVGVICGACQGIIVWRVSLLRLTKFKLCATSPPWSNCAPFRLRDPEGTRMTRKLASILFLLMSSFVAPRCFGNENELVLPPELALAFAK